MTELNAAGLNYLRKKLAKYPAVSISATWNGKAFDVAVSGDTPTIPGHTLVARIDHMDEGNIIVQPSGSAPLPASYRTCPATCSHCLTNRRRNSTFVFDSGIQVGRACLAEYLRSPDAAEAVLVWATISDTIREAEGISGGKRLYDVIELTQAAIACADKFGWGPRGFSIEPHQEEAEAVRDWLLKDVANREENAVDNYLSNLVVAYRQGYVEDRHVNLVVSGFRAYRRERETASALAEPAVTGNYVGELKVRLRALPVTVTFIKQLPDSDYGERFICKMLTATGDTLVWFTGANLKYNEGDAVIIDATPTKHDEYNGVKVTYVSRVSDAK